ncbi:hypothetical protein [Actinoallomurus sp. NPDC050550]|uniref:hypothetical protein n=1 Tax=Actinoallomurus sp. NPDC050550 TaxID=3154937 RepID=UPI0034099FB9
MATDRLSDDTDTDVEKIDETLPAAHRLPPDRPGAEGFPSRAESRAGAAEVDNDGRQSSAQSGTEAADDQKTAGRQGSDSQQEPLVPEAHSGETIRPFGERLDTPLGDDQPTPREVLERFAPPRAGLRELSAEQAKEYIEQNAEQRPWLSSARDSDPAVQRVIAALDQGRGHALERHEGFADDDKLFQRVTTLEDPAQLDADKRVAGIDGCKPGNQDHKCASSATAIQDPGAFATAFARGTEHQKVRETLDMPFASDVYPPPVSIPIDELLGPDGHRYCDGYALTPIAGDRRVAMECRDAFVYARANDRDPDVPPPQATQMESFAGGTVEFFFRPNSAQGSYEVNTMYVEPPKGP